MYTSYFGFREEPFNLTPTSRLFYSNPVYAEAYAKLLAGIRERRGFMLLTGEVGTGKTTLLHRLVNELREDPTVSVASSHYSTLMFEELLGFACANLGLGDGERGLSGEIDTFVEFLAARSKEGGTVVLLLDEAQDLSEDVLEGLFLLWDSRLAKEKLLQVVLVGQQPDLEEKLRQPTLNQLYRNLAVQCQLEHLQAEEVHTFIHHRLLLAGCERRDLFSRRAVQLIASYSEGIPRLINLLCDNVLQAAFEASQETVPPELVQEVARNLRLGKSEVNRPQNHSESALPGSEDERVSPELKATPLQHASPNSLQGGERTPEHSSRSVKTVLVQSILKPQAWGGRAGVLLALLGFAVLASKIAILVQGQIARVAESAPSLRGPYPGSYEQPAIPPEQANAQSSPSPFSVIASRNAVRGRAVLQHLAERYQDMRPVVWGLATANPALALFLPEAEWRKLSKENQVNLTWYLESLVATARVEPDQYIEEFRSTPGYEIFRSKVKSLCLDCWVIAVGHQAEDTKNLLFDKIIVQGDSLWEEADLNNRGVKASEFRDVSMNASMTSSSDSLGEDGKEK